jgi:glycogen(starch) synthase
MRVVLLSPGYPPDAGGGIGAYTATVARGLARAGHETFVVAWVRGSAARFRDGDVTVVLLERRPRRRQTTSRLQATVLAARAVRKLRPDVIQAPEYFADAWLLARTAWRSRLVTRLATPTYLLEQLNEGHVRPETRVLRWLERDQARRSAAVVAPTRALGDLVASDWDLDPRRIRHIPNAVDVDEVRRAGRAESPVELPARFVAFPARAERRKGADVLAAALPRALAVSADVEALFLGGGTPDAVERIGALSGPVANRVRVLEHLPRSEALAVVARAEVVVLPSLWENFSNSALESLALGRPLIATDIGGFPEFVEDRHTGWLVPPGDVDALADCIAARLADRVGTLAVALRGAESVERFSPDAVAAQLSDLYTAIVPRPDLERAARPS